MLFVILESVLCHRCGGSDVIKYGRTAERKQRYKCRHDDCLRMTFIRAYSWGDWPEVKQQIVDIAVNGRDIRDIARPDISPMTVMEELKNCPGNYQSSRPGEPFTLSGSRHVGSNQMGRDMELCRG